MQTTSTMPSTASLPAPYDACEKVFTGVSSLSLVRYRLNDYSVPTTYGHRDVLVRGYVHVVVIACGTEIIARHPAPMSEKTSCSRRCTIWRCSSRKSTRSTRPRLWLAGNCPRCPARFSPVFTVEG
jgi:hypothetical protein